MVTQLPLLGCKLLAMVQVNHWPKLQLKGHCETHPKLRWHLHLNLLRLNWEPHCCLACCIKQCTKVGSEATLNTEIALTTHWIVIDAAPHDLTCPWLSGHMHCRCNLSKKKGLHAGCNNLSKEKESHGSTNLSQENGSCCCSNTTRRMPQGSTVWGQSCTVFHELKTVSIDATLCETMHSSLDRWQTVLLGFSSWGLSWKWLEANLQFVPLLFSWRGASWKLKEAKFMLEMTATHVVEVIHANVHNALGAKKMTLKELVMVSRVCHKWIIQFVLTNQKIISLGASPIAIITWKCTSPSEL